MSLHFVLASMMLENEKKRRLSRMAELAQAGLPIVVEQPERSSYDDLDRAAEREGIALATDTSSVYPPSIVRATRGYGESRIDRALNALEAREMRG